MIKTLLAVLMRKDYFRIEKEERKRGRKDRELLLLGSGEAAVEGGAVHHACSASFSLVTVKHSHMERGTLYTRSSTRINAQKGL